MDPSDSVSSISEDAISPTKLFAEDSPEKTKDLESPTTTSKIKTEGQDESNNTISSLEKKRLELRRQRFSLEQRLYDFNCRHSDTHSKFTKKPTRYVLDMAWLDKSSGIRVVFSGPINEVEEPHGAGAVMKFPDGQIYRGEVYNGTRGGMGSNTWPNGQNYNGEWINNHRTGKGKHVWPDGRKVTGEWKDDHLNGRVRFSWPDGATYEGTCFMGKRHGRGVHTWADGGIYSGNYEHGKQNGFGVRVWTNGSKYRGEWCDNVKEGYGVMLWGTRTYVGEWKQNKPNGQGKLTWANGATYTGTFVNGKYSGMGVYVWPNGTRFVGRWVNGIREEKGLYTWPNGLKYDGGFKNGMKSGFGQLTFKDGSFYSGEFLNNQRHGRGILKAPDGTVVHDGEWKSDKPIRLIQSRPDPPEELNKRAVKSNSQQRDNKDDDSTDKENTDRHLQKTPLKTLSNQVNKDENLKKGKEGDGKLKISDRKDLHNVQNIKPKNEAPKRITVISPSPKRIKKYKSYLQMT